MSLENTPPSQKRSEKEEIENVSVTSPPKIETDAEREARFVNAALENILASTLRKETARSPVCFLPNASLNAVFLSGKNLSEVICYRLGNNVEMTNAVAYLIGCYKRATEKESMASGNLGKEIAGYDASNFLLFLLRHDFCVVLYIDVKLSLSLSLHPA
jgi:hypothetical protein